MNNLAEPGHQELDDFRRDIRGWLAESFPADLAYNGQRALMEADPALAKDLEAWRSALAARGYGAPTWPRQYGGAGLSGAQAAALAEELAAVGAFNPIPTMAGMGVTMVGPTVLEYGTDDQKARHLRGMASGEVRWCLGLSEPNAGSDLASLATKAVRNNRGYVINGQKIWTSGADVSQWCGAVVRTDPDARKRDGISFVMLPMDQPGVRTRPIKLISGASPFCETYFEDAFADQADLLGEENDGWSVVKRLLQHERQSQTSAGRRAADREVPLHELAKTYVGEDANGRVADPDLRARLVTHLMDARAHALTVERIRAEARGDVKVSAAASILKNSATRVAQGKAELRLEIMGAHGIGWTGKPFTESELAGTREWLFGKAMSIYGGSYEIQNNIISKNILGLPETTQKG